MKATGTLICLGGWVLAAAAQLAFTLSVPLGKVVAFGVDLTHVRDMSLMHAAVYITCGLILAIAAILAKKWRFPLVVIASLFYLLHWFPWRMVGKYGFTAVAHSKYLAGSIPSLRFISVIRDIVLPIAFTVAIALAISERRRYMVTAEGR